MAASTNKSNKILQTRIQVKYDTYAKWIEKNPVLLAGEIAVATIDSGTTQKVGSVDLPQVLIKVGDGNSNYSALPFVSGMAADVYSWAKASVKPTYTAGEIGGLTEAIENSSTYQLVPNTTDANKKYVYDLQIKTGETENKEPIWETVSTIDLNEVNTRLGGAESRLTTVEAAAKKANDDLGTYKTQVPGIIDTAIGTAIADLNADVKQDAAKSNGYLALQVVETEGELTSVSGSVNVASIKADIVDVLDAEFSKAAGTDGLIYNLVQTDGKITNFEASIKDGTYEKAGSISAALAGLTGDYTNTAPSGASVGIVTSISQEVGDIKANVTELAFTDSYSATNPLATKAFVEGHVADIMADIEGGMHFIGKFDALPTASTKIPGKDETYVPEDGDVIIVGEYEYVYASNNEGNSPWIELGNLTPAQGMINAALDAAKLEMAHDTTGSVAKTITAVKQVNGKITTVTYEDIKIASDAVTHGDETVKSELEDHESRIGAMEEAIGDINTGFQGSVNTLIEAAIGALDDEVTAQTASASNGWVSADLVQTNGIVKSLTVSVDGSKYDAAGAAAAVLGKDGDASTANTVYGAKKAAAEALAEAEKRADELAAFIEGSLNGSAIATATSNGTVNVLTGVKQEDGELSKVSEVNISKVGQTGKVQDLIQDNNTYIILNCGTAETNID